jgi:hypothetical protein
MPQQNRNKYKIKNIKKFKLKLAIVGAVAFALIGILTLRLSNAATYDGYQRLRIVQTAERQLGNVEYNPQVMQYTEGNPEAWCADFVSWVYKQAGYAFNAAPAAGRSSWRIPLVNDEVAGVPNLRSYFRKNGAYKTKESFYVPSPGDVVIFARQGRSHTGIVVRVEQPANKNEKWIYTIEGNTDTNDVGRRAYPMSDGTIDGYGTIINAPPTAKG